MHPWLTKLRHDLVKRCVWPARDLRDAGEAPHASDLRALRAALFELPDAEGRPVSASALWTLLLDEAPAAALREPAVAQAAKTFAETVARAEAAVDRLVRAGRAGAADFPDTLRAVLEIDEAFHALARELNSLS